MHTLYAAYNTVNGKRYVGQTNAPVRERWQQHVRFARRGNRYPFQSALGKHGAASFEVFPVVEAKTQAQANNLEKLFIIVLQANANDYPATGYNVANGGIAARSGPQKPPSAETRARISETLKRVYRSGEVPHPTKGKKKSPKVAAHLRNLLRSYAPICRTGKKHSAEAKEKMRLKKLGTANHAGHLHSSESKALMSLKQKAAWARRRA